MKKYLKFICAIILFLTFTLTVSAYDEDTVKFEWKNTDLSIEYAESVYADNDGYLMGGYDDDFAAYIIKTDKKGNETKHLSIPNQFTIVSINKIDNKYYTVVLDDDFYISIYVLDKDFNIVNKVNTDYYLNDWNDNVSYKDGYIYITSTGWYGFTGVKDEDDEEYLLLKISEDLKVVEPVEYVSNNWEPNKQVLISYFGSEYGEMVYDKNFYEVPIKAIRKNKTTVIVGKISPNDSDGGFIVSINDNGKTHGNGVDQAGWWYTDAVIHNNYIYAIGENYGRVDIYNSTLTLVGYIDLAEVYKGEIANPVVSADNIKITNDGLFVSYFVCDNKNGCATNCEEGIALYGLKYDIETTVKGNGKIDVISESWSGEEVTYKVTPEAGYVLKSVKVTDEEGNVITFYKDTFTMPNSNVTIEVTFEKKQILDIINPNTGDFTIYALIAITILLGILTVHSYRRREMLR